MHAARELNQANYHETTNTSKERIRKTKLNATAHKNVPKLQNALMRNKVANKHYPTAMLALLLKRDLTKVGAKSALTRQ